MRWRPRLLTEEAVVRITKFRMAKLDYPSMIFEIEYRVTPDEVRRAAMEADIAPSEPPVRFTTADQLIEAIRTERFPGGVTLDDVLFYARKVGLMHLVSPRTDEGIGGIEKSEANAILATIYHKVKERTLAAMPQQDEAAVKEANKIAFKVQASIIRPDKFGGDWRAAKGQPGSVRHRQNVIPALVDQFMKVSHGPVIKAAKNMFSVFPTDWQKSIFGPKDEYIQYVDMKGAGHFRGKHTQEFLTKRAEGLANKAAAVVRGIEQALTGNKAVETNWLSLYSLVVIPLDGFRAQLSNEFTMASEAGKIQQIGELDGFPEYQWDTGITGFAEWLAKIDLLSGNDLMTLYLNNILGSSNLRPADSILVFNQRGAEPAQPPEPQPAEPASAPVGIPDDDEDAAPAEVAPRYAPIPIPDDDDDDDDAPAEIDPAERQRMHEPEDDIDEFGRGFKKRSNDDFFKEDIARIASKLT